MAIVPRSPQPMPEWATQAVEHLEYVARLLAENGMDCQANYLDRVISVIFRHTRKNERPALLAVVEGEHGPELMKMLDRHGAGDAEVWRSIESAPRDGTRILAFFNDDWIESIAWSILDAEWKFASDGDAVARKFNPTHWMPRPSAPVTP